MPETANHTLVGNTNSHQQEERNEPASKRLHLGKGQNLEEEEVEEHPPTQTRDDIDMDRNTGNQGNEDPPPPLPPPPASLPPLPPAYLENLHMQFSHRDLAPLLHTESRIAYTQGYFPQVVKSLDALLLGIKEITAEAIKNQPNKFIALLVYGGGDKIKEENPNLMKDIQAFLQGLVIKETHASEDCPYPKVTDWKGPIPKEVMTARENHNEDANTRGGTRGRGGQGGGRGTRGVATNTRRNRPY